MCPPQENIDDHRLRGLQYYYLKIRVAYVMTCRGEVVCTGESSHCIMDANGRPVSLKKSYPELYANYEAYHQNQGDYKL